MLGKLPVLCVLFATCGGGIVKNGVPGQTTETPPRGVNATLACPPPEPRRVTLERGEYEVLPDGTLLVSSSRHSVNPSSYALGVDGVVTACLPPPESKDVLDLLKPLYYATISVVLHLLVPFLVCRNQSFNGMDPDIYDQYFYTTAITYFTGHFLFWIPKYPMSHPFESTWYSLPSYLSVLGLNLAGGLAALHSDQVTALLADSGQIYVRKGMIFVVKTDLIVKGTALSGAMIFLLTYALVMSFDKGPDYSTLHNQMSCFLPSCLMYLFVNLNLVGDSLLGPPAVLSDDWRTVQNRHMAFFWFFSAAFANWTFGSVVTVTGCWDLWVPFVVFSVVILVALCLYIFRNSREVLCCDRKSIKILKVDGDVLTIRLLPSKRQEKTGADRKIHPAEREFKKLPLVVEKTGSDKEKQPAEKEFKKLPLVVEETGADKEKLTAKKEFKLELFGNLGAGKEKQPVREEFELAFVVEYTGEDNEEQPAERELLLIEKTGAGREKQVLKKKNEPSFLVENTGEDNEEKPAEKDFDLVLVAKTESGKEKQVVKKKNEPSFLVEDTGEDNEKHPAEKEFDLVLVAKTGADKEKQLAENEFVVATWPVLPWPNPK